MKTKLKTERATTVIATITTVVALAIIGSVVALSPAQTTAQTTQDVIRLYDGDLIKSPSNPDVYIVKYINNKWFKRLILNPEIFNSYGHLSWDNIKTVNQSTIDQHTTSHLVVEVNANGAPVNGRVYYLTSAPNADTGIKHHLNVTPQEFESLGLDWDSIYKINSTEAGPTFYRTGTPITVSNFNTITRGTPTQQGTTTPVTTNQDASFRATLSSNITGIEIGKNQQREVAEFTLRSTDNNSTIDDVTLRLSPRGSGSKNKNLADSFTDIELLLNGSSVKKIATSSSSAVRKIGEDYHIHFNFIPDVVIEAGTTEQLTVQVHTKTSLTTEHFQEWSVAMEEIDLVGTYAEEYKTPAARIFTVAKEKIPFITVNHEYNQYLIGHNNRITIDSDSAQNKNLLVASISNKTAPGEEDETVVLDSLQVRIQPPDTRYIADNINSVSLYVGSQRLGTTQMVNASNPSSIFTFPNLNRQIRPNQNLLVTVQANIQPQSTARNTDITTTIPSAGMRLRYSTNNQPVENGFITGTARNTAHLSIARPGSIATAFLPEPVNPHITTTTLTDIGVLQMTANHSNTRIHRIQVALEPQGADHKPYGVFRQMNLLVDGRTYTKTLSTSSAYTRNGSTYTVLFDNLSIPISQNRNKNATIQIQTISNPANSPTQEWRLSVPSQGIQGTNNDLDQYNTNNPTKNFFVGDTVYSTLGQNNPEAQTFSAKQTNNKVELLEFRVANHSATNHTIDSFTVRLTGNQLGTGKTLNNIVRKIYLIENNRVIQTITNTPTLSPTASTDVSFNNLNRALNRGAEKTFKVAIDVPQQDTTQYSYSSGAQIRASLTRVNLTNSAVSLSNTLDGNWMTFIKAGVVSLTKHIAPDNTIITPRTTHEVSQFTLSVDGEAVEIKTINVLLSRVSGSNNNPWDIIDRIELYDQTTRIGYLSLSSSTVTDNRVSFIAPIRLSTPLSLRQINPRTITVKLITKRLSNDQWNGVWNIRLRALNATSDRATFTLSGAGLNNLQVWTTSTTEASLRWLTPVSSANIHRYEIEYCDITDRTSCARWSDVVTTGTPQLTAALTSQSTEANISGLDADKVYRFRIRYTQINPTRYSTWVTTDDVHMAAHGTTITPVVSGFVVSTSNPPTTNTIHLEWTKALDTEYQIEYRKSGDSDWAQGRLSVVPKNSNPSVLQAIFSGLNQGITYEFQVRALKNNQLSAWSSTLPATTTLNPPRSLKATTTATSITLSWTQPSGIKDTSELAYEIEACQPDIIGTATSSHCSGTDWKTITTTSTSSHETLHTFTVINSNSIVQNASYDIRIRAVRGSATPPQSQWIVIGNVVTKRSVEAPTTLRLSALNPPTTNTLTIEWDSIQSAQYEAQYCSPSTGNTCTNREWITADNAIVHTISQRPGVAQLRLRSLTPGTRYNVRVKTTLGGSESPWSTILQTRTKLSTPVLAPSLTQIDTTNNGESITVFYTRSVGTTSYKVDWCEYEGNTSCPTTDEKWLSTLIDSPTTTAEVDIRTANPESGQRYRVRVRAQALTTDLASLTPGTSEWSTPITVTIP
ncbi:MAG: fibronectin type III domain-containing protein [Candidatus Spechtbacteria bacterium SB0662_bin_43]|uniref:Fibronectin type III domain-containing protein n=1 Tax=Candidatus Spechtbacteria bacterium SB0662_bin_43 TaxID=2604897 RepID=A0A845D9Z9_9BACT|nr:fibronectin type III domain-containing protein [Candidatus Spechtbacteria bacterium SB0662_bin_43]